MCSFAGGHAQTSWAFVWAQARRRAGWSQQLKRVTDPRDWSRICRAQCVGRPSSTKRTGTYDGARRSGGGRRNDWQKRTRVGRIGGEASRATTSPVLRQHPGGRTGTAPDSRPHTRLPTDTQRSQSADPPKQQTIRTRAGVSRYPCPLGHRGSTQTRLRLRRTSRGRSPEGLAAAGRHCQRRGRPRSRQAARLQSL